MSGLDVSALKFYLARDLFRARVGYDDWAARLHLVLNRARI